MGPNLADLSGTASTAIAGGVYELLGIPKEKIMGDIASPDEGDDARSSSGPRPSSGAALERDLEADIRDSLALLDPDRGWFVTRSGNVDQFSQFEHLRRLQRLFETDRTLKSTVGRDYQVSTDVMVGVPNRTTAPGHYTLHAAISSKLTIRSDRVQNIRFEFGTLVRNRRGRLPHLVVVTAEPLPSRLISIGRGTGEIDAVYHLLFDEMSDVLGASMVPGVAGRLDLAKQRGDWEELVETRRVRPYLELASVLAVV